MGTTTFTVAIVNDLLKQGHYEGTFATQELAQAHADKLASGSRSFARFRVWQGTPRNPIDPVGAESKGRALAPVR